MDERKAVMSRAPEGALREFPREELIQSCDDSERSAWRLAARGWSRGVASIAMARVFHPDEAMKIELRLKAIEVEPLIQHVPWWEEDSKAA
jgi:hypothetical protein